MLKSVLKIIEPSIIIHNCVLNPGAVTAARKTGTVGSSMNLPELISEFHHHFLLKTCKQRRNKNNKSTYNTSSGEKKVYESFIKSN